MAYDDTKVIDDYGRTEKGVYNELEKDFSIPKELGKTLDEAELNEAELFFFEDDANELLANIGLEQNIDLTNYPREQLVRIFRYYHPKSEQIIDGKKKYVDPLPYYTSGKEGNGKELFKFGYSLGKKGEIGIYYRLLPDTNFRHGYWVGKFERAIELDDTKKILEVSKEIKIYDAIEAENELGNIVNNIFIVQDNNEQKTK